MIPPSNRASFAEVFDRLREGRAAVEVVPTGAEPGEPVPVHLVFVTDWDPIFHADRPATPSHCPGAVVANRFVTERFPIEVAGFRPGRLDLHLEEHDAPFRSGFSHSIRWELRLDEALLASVEAARLQPRGADGWLALEPGSREGVLAWKDRYGGEQGAYWGDVPFRDLYRALLAGELELVVESPAVEGGELRVPLRASDPRGWVVNCT